jgi:hypothetical protein
LGDFMNVQCHACIGGTNLGEDIRKLDYGQHVVSGTPGRVYGMLALIVFNSITWFSKYIIENQNNYIHKKKLYKTELSTCHLYTVWTF